eukprot:3296790-Amphidinium_carterae.1
MSFSFTYLKGAANFCSAEDLKFGLDSWPWPYAHVHPMQEQRNDPVECPPQETEPKEPKLLWRTILKSPKST